MLYSLWYCLYCFLIKLNDTTVCPNPLIHRPKIFCHFVDNIYRFCNSSNHWVELHLNAFTRKPRGWFNTCIKMSSYQYRNSHCGDRTSLQLSYLRSGISDTDLTTSIYWIRHWCLIQIHLIWPGWGRKNIPWKPDNIICLHRGISYTGQ